MVVSGPHSGLFKSHFRLEVTWRAVGDPVPALCRLCACSKGVSALLPVFFSTPVTFLRHHKLTTKPCSPPPRGSFHQLKGLRTEDKQFRIPWALVSRKVRSETKHLIIVAGNVEEIKHEGEEMECILQKKWLPRGWFILPPCISSRYSSGPTLCITAWLYPQETIDAGHSFTIKKKNPLFVTFSSSSLPLHCLRWKHGVFLLFLLSQFKKKGLLAVCGAGIRFSFVWEKLNHSVTQVQIPPPACY